jgi:hypothetical protein
MMKCFISFRCVTILTQRLGYLLMLALIMVSGQAFAHPMPNSMVLLNLRPDGVTAELQLPLSELQLAFGKDVASDASTLVERLGTQLSTYIIAHVRPVSDDNRAWLVTIRDMKVTPVEASASGPYQELSVNLWLQPPAGASSRTFTLNYDVIIHQLVTHIALVSIRQDWEGGIYTEQLPVEAGVIRLDVRSNTIPPLKIAQANGSYWNGFVSMVKLGIHHIAEGTDHLLFVLVLLISAPLLAHGGKWNAFGGTRYTLMQLFRVVTAFTIGHSITLLVGALGWLHFPSQPVEILIAFSILVSAVHAWRPIFPGREAYIAAGFGLIHGLAFAGTLENLDLPVTPMMLSILGFNIGIELMQLFVIAITIPWLILLSRTIFYKGIRIGGALLAAIAASGWLVERFLQQGNLLTQAVERMAAYSHWVVLVLACASFMCFILDKSRNRKTV